MAYQTGTASNQFDLLDKIRTFVTSTMTPSAERWQTQRWFGYRSYFASSYLGSYEPTEALGGDSGEWRTSINVTTGYLGVRLVVPLDCRKFAITATATSTRSPKDFSIQYSSDGSTWTTLQSWTAQGFTAGQRIVYSVTSASPGAKDYWRLNVTANNGATDHLAISELEFLEDIDATVTLNHCLRAQLYLKGVGLAGTESIFVGLGLYENPTSDIFNLRIAHWTGYVPSSIFEAQPGSSGNMGVPVWDQPMTYWIVANGQRIVVVVKVDTVYQTFYLGKFFAYATPGQYPYPVVIGGMLSTDSLTRFSDTSLSIPYKGSRPNFKVRLVNGSWIQPQSWPWVNTNTFRDCGGQYPMQPVVLTDPPPGTFTPSDVGPNVYGELDGVFYVTGFGNAVENLINDGTNNYLVVQDVYRNGLRDYFAIKLA